MLASKLITTLQEAIDHSGDYECAIIDGQDATTASMVDGVVYDEHEGAFIICNDAQFAAIKEEDSD